jgi:hypothetical protein
MIVVAVAFVIVVTVAFVIVVTVRRFICPDGLGFPGHGVDRSPGDLDSEEVVDGAHDRPIDRFVRRLRQVLGSRLDITGPIGDGCLVGGNPSDRGMGSRAFSSPSSSVRRIEPAESRRAQSALVIAEASVRVRASVSVILAISSLADTRDGVDGLVRPSPAHISGVAMAHRSTGVTLAVAMADRSTGVTAAVTAALTAAVTAAMAAALTAATAAAVTTAIAAAVSAAITAAIAAAVTPAIAAAVTPAVAAAITPAVAAAITSAVSTAITATAAAAAAATATATATAATTTTAFGKCRGISEIE